MTGTSLLDVYADNYRRHNLETRQLDRCEGGVEWAWLELEECLQGPFAIGGYVVAVASLPVWVLGCVVHYRRVSVESRDWLWSQLFLHALVSLASLLAAIFSMQLTLVICQDLVSLLTVSLTAVVFLVQASLGKRDRPPYRRVYDMQKNPCLEGSPQPSLCWTSAPKLCCLPIAMFVTSSMIITESARDLHFRDSSSLTAERQSSQKGQITMVVLGYTLACLASFGHWALAVWYLKFYQYLEEQPPQGAVPRQQKRGVVLLIASDAMFLTGLLLQSGGLHVVMVTMPWVLGRFLHLVCQLVSLTSRKWLYICAGGEDTTMEEPDPEEAFVRRQSTLLGSSESETSDVLWDRSWQLPGKPEVRVFDDDEASLLLPKTVHLGSAAKASTRIRSATLDLTTSSGTECSTTSQEQELEWEDRRGISLFAPCQSPVLPRPSYPLATRVSTLDIPPTETYDQRVRTWISQSTPEEETPPSLTLILNLDTTLDPGGELFVDRDRKTNLGALSHQRKNSF